MKENRREKINKIHNKITADLFHSVFFIIYGGVCRIAALGVLSDLKWQITQAKYIDFKIIKLKIDQYQVSPFLTSSFASREIYLRVHLTRIQKQCIKNACIMRCYCQFYRIHFTRKAIKYVI
jgi:hypothetical protein